jgi:tripartite-type tricarboxylate transporter receptor subunit TctC
MSVRFKKALTDLSAAAVSVICCLAASAADYPARPIRFVLPFPPGGATELLGRIVGQKLNERVGQPVVIDSRGGAGGNLGLELAALAAPDGYTIVLAPPSLAISPSLYKRLHYDPVKDFAPVTMVATIPMGIFANPGLPPALKDVIALAKAKPGQLNYGSGGNGTSLHLAGELFKLQAGVNIVHIPYKGSSLALTDLIGGRLQLVFIGIPAPAPHVKSGRLRALAVIAAQRSPQLPETPTVAEAGMPGFEVTTWYGILAPAKTPRAIVTRLNREVSAILKDPETKERLAVIGAEPAPGAPEEFGTYIKQEIAKWADVVRKAGLQAD